MKLYRVYRNPAKNSGFWLVKAIKGCGRAGGSLTASAGGLGVKTGMLQRIV